MKLRLVSREFDGFERSFGHQIDEFKKLHPAVEITAEFLDLATLHQEMLSDGGAKSGSADIFLCVTDWLPEAIQAGALTPLNSFLEADPPQDWPHGWSPSMRGLQTAQDGQIYGLAYHDGPEIFMYRRDLFEDPSEKARFESQQGRELTPPKTWDEFIEVAKFFTRAEEGLWGACLAGFPDAHNNVYDFMIHLWSRGGSLLTKENRAAFNSPEGIAALQYLHDLYHLHKVVDPKCLDLDSVASGIHYASGQAAMMWNWSGFAALAEDKAISKIVGKNGVAGMPRAEGPDGKAVSLNIYWVLTIPSGTENKQAAYDFIRHCASASMDKATSMLGGNGTRLSTWRDSEVQAAFPYYKIIEEVHTSVESPPSIPQFTQIAEYLSEMTDDVMRQRKSVKEAIGTAASRVDDLMARV